MREYMYTVFCSDDFSDIVLTLPAHMTDCLTDAGEVLFFPDLSSFLCNCVWYAVLF